MEENIELMTMDNIYNRVYFIRGQQVMLDYDLAAIYGYEVKRLNEQVKRNIVRFPEDFMFQLTRNEIPEEFLKSQISTLNEQGNRRGVHIKNIPMLLLSKVFICLQLFLGVSWQNSKVYLSCAHFVRCGIYRSLSAGTEEYICGG